MSEGAAFSARVGYAKIRRPLKPPNMGSLRVKNIPFSQSGILR